MATHSSILFWEMQWTEEPGGYRNRAGTQATYRWGFSGVSVIKNPPANAGEESLIPGLGRPPRRRK